MREAGSNIDYESFVIIDDRTLQDDTVLVVVKELLTEDEADQATNAEVRMSSEIASFRLGCYLAAEGDILEDVVKSQRHADGVLRDAYEMLTAEEEERLYGPFEDCTCEGGEASQSSSTMSRGDTTVNTTASLSRPWSMPSS